MIIVTGASRGIGKAICERLISNKVEVIGIARNIKDLSFEAIKCDVSSYEEIKNVVTKIKKKVRNFRKIPPVSTQKFNNIYF